MTQADQQPKGKSPQGQPLLSAPDKPYQFILFARLALISNFYSLCLKEKQSAKCLPVSPDATTWRITF